VDIKRDPPKKTKRNILIGGGVLGLIAVTVALSQLEARPPSVTRSEIIIDSVKRGTFVREVRAPGTLVPENIRYVAAVTGGRVEDRPLRPGSQVTANTVILVLSNPDVQLEALEAQRQLASAEADFVTLRTNLENGKLAQESAIATLKTQHSQAVRDLAMYEELDKKQLSSVYEIKRAREQVEELATRLDIAQRQLELSKGAMTEQIDKARDNVERSRTVSQFQQVRLASLRVTAGLDGVLQSLNLELGQWVNPSQEVARVAQPGRFKAVLRVPETQAPDVVVGQKVSVDTRNGIVPGEVMRVDPISQQGTVTVEVSLSGDMPPGARGDLSVDGTIEIERLTDVLFVQRPAYGQPDATVGLFKLESDGRTAVRTNVKLGKASVNQIEVQGGLQVGDRIIITDMTTYDNATKVRIN
jgi:multidrug efflux pump subunit AcrA (membrane-fusion protein)